MTSDGPSIDVGELVVPAATPPTPPPTSPVNRHKRKSSSACTPCADDYPFLNPKEFSFHCIYPECKKQFTLTNDLYDHVRTHSMDLKCPICGHPFTCMASLVYHARTHTGRKPYLCPLKDCEFKTTTKGNLKAHLLCLKHTYVKISSFFTFFHCLICFCSVER